MATSSVINFSAVGGTSFSSTGGGTGGGTAGNPGGSDTQVQFNDGGSFAGATGLTFAKTTEKLSLSGVQLALTGNISAASWGLTGLKLQGGTSTLTDTSAAGTVATGATNVLGGNTIAASNARTITDYYSAYINPPTAGTNVTLTNKWALGLAGAQVIAAGTFTTAQSALDITQTWNNGSTVFTGLKLNITDTTSSAASLLADLQVGGISKFKVDKIGGVTANNVSLNGYITLTSGQKTLTNNVTSNLASFIISTGNIASGTLKYYVEAKDASSNSQSEMGSVSFTAINKANTLSYNNLISQDVKANTTGTLTCTTNTLATGNTLIVQLTANTSLTTTSFIAKWSLEHNGTATVI